MCGLGAEIEEPAAYKLSHHYLIIILGTVLVLPPRQPLLMKCLTAA